MWVFNVKLHICLSKKSKESEIRSLKKEKVSEEVFISILYLLSPNINQKIKVWILLYFTDFVLFLF